MAKNLQKNLPATDTLVIQDINADAMNKFLSEVQAQSGGAVVKIASSVREAAENSVRISFITLSTFSERCISLRSFIFYMMSVFQTMISKLGSPVLGDFTRDSTFYNQSQSSEFLSICSLLDIKLCHEDLY
jgi:hypothetical protein